MERTVNVEALLTSDDHKGSFSSKTEETGVPFRSASYAHLERSDRQIFTSCIRTGILSHNTEKSG
ncbi:MAG: hypothetical protein DWI00_05690 [Planctomycetota bacterium]|nr:MAG: hypothetical protein DWI00_05690 [Planctomycetota bacterium]